MLVTELFLVVGDKSFSLASVVLGLVELHAGFQGGYIRGKDKDSSCYC